LFLSAPWLSHCPWFWSLTWHAGGEGGGGGAGEGDGVGGLGVRLVMSGGRLGEGGAEGVGWGALYCPTGIGLIASAFVAESFDSPFPNVQLASWKLVPSGPVPPLREAHPSWYFHLSLVSSVLKSPNVSITVRVREFIR
jgi:hypothetical protein